MDTNDIWVLNPDYHFRNDFDRICLYSKNYVKLDSNKDWTSFIHPYQFVILSNFCQIRSIGKNIKELAEYFHLSENKINDLIQPYLANSTPIHTEWKNTKIHFPKNLLVPLDWIRDGEIVYNTESLEFNFDFDHIDVTHDRCHKIPNSMLWMLTNKCATNCAYCYADKKTRYTPLSTQKSLEIIESAHSLGMAYIDIIGGEVFLKKDWNIILEKLVEYGMSPSYISTKVPVIQDDIHKLKDTGYNNVVQFSIDSLDSEILWNLIRVKSQYIEHMMTCIDMFDKAGFKIQIDTILTRYTATAENLETLSNFIIKIKNLEYWEIRVPEFSLYSSHRFKQVMATRKELEEIHSYVENHLKKHFNKTILFNADPLYAEYRIHGPEDICFKGGNCGLLYNRMFLLPDGKVSVCEQSYWHPEFIIGDLSTQDIDEVWQSEKAQRLFTMTTESYREESQCRKCSHLVQCSKNKRRCAVKVMKAYGLENWDYPDPRCRFAPPLRNPLEYL